MNGSDPIAWLFARQRFGIAPGLERVRALLTALGDPQETLRVVLVGGTNGKGSTTAALAAMLSERERVGRFVSPHLNDVTERFVVDGRALPRAALTTVIAELQTPAERVGATFFEIVTAAACRLFADAGVTTAVMEVGLGGTLDSTNALEPALSIVTNVALDHQAVLGGDLATIARDKAGILRPGAPAITGAEGEALAEIEGAAARLAAPLWRLGREVRVGGSSLGWQGNLVRVATELGAVRARSPLLGEHQRTNLALAAAAALRLGATPEQVVRALPEVRWPGRLEPVERGGRRILLDGAHNPAAATALAAALGDLVREPVTLLLGISSDKDAAAIGAALAPRTGRVILTRAAASPRALPAAALAEAVSPAFRELPLALHEPATEALERALSATPAGGVVVVAGSLFLVAEVRAALLGLAREPYPRDQ